VDASIELGCLALLVRLPVRPNGKPWPIDNFLWPRSSANLPATPVVSLSGVDRSRYLLPLIFDTAGNGDGPEAPDVPVFVRLVDT
jgi:hypothetical protein